VLFRSSSIDPGRYFLWVEYSGYDSDYDYEVALVAEQLAGEPAVPVIMKPPQSQTQAVGGSVQFQVEVAGGGELSYQWSRNAEEMNGETDATLVLHDVDDENDGDLFRVLVSNEYGSVIAGPARLSVQQSQLIEIGQTYDLDVPARTSKYLKMEIIESGTYRLAFGDAESVGEGSPWFDVIVSGPTGTEELSVDGYDDVSEHLLDLGAGQWVIEVAMGDIYSDSGRFSLALDHSSQLVLNQAVEIRQRFDWGDTWVYPISIAEYGLSRFGLDGWCDATIENDSIYHEFTASAEITNIDLYLDPGLYELRLSPGRGSGVISVLWTDGVDEDVPIIITQPQDVSITEGRMASFKVATDGPSKRFHEWFINGNPVVPSESGEHYSFAAFQHHDQDQIRTRVTSIAGSVDSEAATVTVREAPAMILGSEQVFVVPPGSEDVYRLTVASDGGYAISLDSNSNLTLEVLDVSGGTMTPGIQPGTSRNLALKAGAYLLRARASYGSASGIAVALVTPITEPPRIVVEPQDQVIIEGAPLALRVQAEGSLLSYQWSVDGSDIPLATNNVHAPPALLGQHDGHYRVRVSNPVGTVESASADVSVTMAPLADIDQTIPVTVEPGVWNIYRVIIPTENLYLLQNDNYSVSVDLLEPDSGVVVWSTYTRKAVLSAGTYLLRVRGNYPSYSGNASITLRPYLAPTIISDLVDSDVVESSRVEFAVEVAGDSLLYEWFINREPIDISRPSNSLVRWAYQAQDGNRIQVRISNDAGNVVSHEALLNVIPAPAYHPGTVVEVTIPSGELESKTYRVSIDEGAGYTLSLESSSRLRVNLSDINGHSIGYALENGKLHRYLAPGDYLLKVSSRYYNGGYHGGTGLLSMTNLEAPTILTHPSSMSVTEGESATFTVSASGQINDYRWLLDGVPLDADAQTYEMDCFRRMDQSELRVSVNGEGGSTLSEPAVITVLEAPSMAVDSSVQIEIARGEVDVYRVQIIDSGGYDIALDTSSYLSVDVLDVEGREIGEIRRGDEFNIALKAGVYLLRVRGYNQYSYGSGTLSVSSLGAPEIITQPQSITLTEGMKAEFSVLVNGGDVSYDWFRNGLSLDTDWSPNPYSIYTVYRLMDQDQYQVQVSGVSGMVMSDPATLTVQSAPQVTIDSAVGTQLSLPPGGRDVCRFDLSTRSALTMLLTSEDRIRVSVMSDQGGAYSKAWLSPGTNTYLELEPGGYLLIAQDQSSYRPTGGTGELTIGYTQIPIIIEDPKDVSVIEGGVARFSVVADGEDLSYQWYHNGVAIETYNQGAEYAVTATRLMEGDEFHVEVSNLAGLVGSQSARVHVQAAPLMTLDVPVTTSVDQGGTDVYRLQLIETTAIKLTLESNDNLRVTVNDIFMNDLLSIWRNRAGYIRLLPGEYLLRVQGSYSSSSGSGILTASVLKPPSIDTQPSSFRTFEGRRARFEVGASGENIRYLWYVDGILRSQTVGYYEFDVKLTDDGSLVRVDVENFAGTAASDTVTLTVLPTPVLELDTSFSDRGANFSRRHRYKFVVPDAGDYRIHVDDEDKYYESYGRMDFYADGRYQKVFYGATTLLDLVPGNYEIVLYSARYDAGSEYTISYYEASGPTIVRHPVDATVQPDGTASFSIEAVGGPPISYQWLQNGVAIADATDSSLILPNANSTPEGAEYAVRAANLDGETVSQSAKVLIDTRLPQQITGFDSLEPRVYGDGPFTIYGVSGGGSNNPILFASSDPTIASTDGSTVTIHAAGQVDITATQAGTIEYAPAAPVTRNLQIDRAPQSILFEELGQISFGHPPMEIAAQATSGLPVNLSLVSGAGSLHNGLLTIEDAGTLVIKTEQLGDSNFLPAAEVQRNLEVVAAAPVITVQPLDGTLSFGESVVLNVTVANPYAAVYQWYRDGVAVTDGDAGSLLVRPEIPGLTTYQVKVSNRFGETGSSIVVIDAVYTAPTIMQQPVAAEVLEGQTALFSVMAHGSPVLSYQWLRDGQPIDGAASAVYETGVLDFSDNGSIFSVEVSNSAGTVTSIDVPLAVLVPPSIIKQPEDKEAIAGQAVSFDVEAIGSAPLYFQWYRDGSLIIDATVPDYELVNPQIQDDGAVFTVRISNGQGTIESQQAVLSVTVEPPLIIEQPQDLRVGLGETGLLRVVASSGSPPGYQWYCDGIEIPGATSSELVINGSQVGSTSYWAVVENAGGQVRSDTVAVEVLTMPVSITQDPKSIAVPIGMGATLLVKASGTPPLTYQWYRDGTAIAGATTASYALGGLALSDDGALFEVEVSNVLGSVRSGQALLTVYGPPTLIASPLDQWAYEGTQVRFSVRVESVGPVSYQWFRDGIPLIGETGRVYISEPISLFDDGMVYSVEASNAAGRLSGGSAILHVEGRLPQQIIGFDPFEPHRLDERQIELHGIIGGDSGEPVTFTSSDVEIASIRGQTILLHTSGSIEITAHQRGNSLYAPAPDIRQTLVIGKGSQDIAFPEISPLPYGTQPFFPVAEATSGLPVEFTILGGPAHISNRKQIILMAAGTVVIAADQAGSSNYEPAQRVERHLVVEEAAPVIIRQPQSVVAAVDASFSLSVDIANPYGATYQWYRDDQPVQGETRLKYDGIVPAPDDPETYSIEVSNIFGRVMSESCLVQGAILHPSVLEHPEPLTLFAGEPALFSVTAEGSEPLHFQWFRNGVAVPGATASTWDRGPVSGSDDDSVIHVEVQNEAGTAISDGAVLQVHREPSINEQPDLLRIAAGDVVLFSVLVDSSLPLKYQWQRDGVDIPGADQASHQFETELSDDGSLFRVAVSNELGSVLSEAVVLTVYPVPPRILSQPSSVAIGHIDEEVGFHVTASSSQVMLYQWYRNGVALPGEQGRSLVFRAAAADLGAVYSVVVTNEAGSISSGNVTVALVAKPLITYQPYSASVVEGGVAVFSVGAESFDPERVLSYQWLRDGHAISHADESSLRLEGIRLDDDGAIFTVLVSDGPVGVLSDPAVLTVDPEEVVEPSAPVITWQPHSVSLDPGQRHYFSVHAKGTEPIRYQWYRDAVAIPGSTEQAHEIPPIQDQDYGSQYHVVVSNELGSVESTVATIRGVPKVISYSTVPEVDERRGVIWPVLGAAVTLRIQARGARPMSYRWFRDGIEMPSGGSSAHVISGLTAADEAPWRVQVENAHGMDSFSFTGIDVFDEAPTMVDQPQDQHAMLGRTASFEAFATSHPDVPLTYQWYRNGVAMPGQTGPTYRLNSVRSSDFSSRYTVSASNAFRTVVSDEVGLIQIETLSIVQQPHSTTVNVGERASFSVTTNTQAEVKYFWRRNGFEMDEGKRTISTAPVSLDDHGTTYDVVVRGLYGQDVVSDRVMLSVIDNPPVILGQPSDAYATIGQSVHFEVTASGSRPMDYQWFVDGQPIHGQNHSLLSLPVHSVVQSGSRITVAISNARGSIRSAEAVLTVGTVPASIISEPDLIAEVHGDSVVLHPRAIVSNGDREHTQYFWERIRGNVQFTWENWQSDSRLVLRGLSPGMYHLRCKARYQLEPYAPTIDETAHDFRFIVSGQLEWISSPAVAGELTSDMMLSLSGLAGFDGQEDRTIRYEWSQSEGPAEVFFTNNHSTEAQHTQVRFTEPGAYRFTCTACWRNQTIEGNLRFTTEADDEEKQKNMRELLAEHSLLIATGHFDARRWRDDVRYRATYLGGVEPGRVWQTAQPAEGVPDLRASTPRRLVAEPGSIIQLSVQGAAFAPFSFACLHGGLFPDNGLNALTAIDQSDGRCTIPFQVPDRSGTYVIAVASPAAVGRIMLTVVVP
jgi:hypothetical protein